MTSLLIEIARGGITGLLTRVMREAARDHQAFSRDDLIAAAQSELAYARERKNDGSGWFTDEWTPAEAWRVERSERHLYDMPRCRGGWPTVTIEEVTFFDAPHASDGSIGTVLACYDTDGGRACALYGFQRDGSITLWAN